MGLLNMNLKRPLIGVTASARGGRYMWWCNYLAIILSGGRARRIFPGFRTPLERFEGFVIGGGDDITPTLYGDEIDPAVRLDPDRDRLEQRILDHADAARLPVLGICRGAQMINVHQGGSIHREVREVYVDAPHVRTVLPRKRVEIKPGSRLATIVRRRAIIVNALHHQSISQLGHGLSVVAEDLWRIVQGVEMRGSRFVMGVQWHPEFLFFLPSHLRLFRALVKAARRTARQKRAKSSERES